MSGIRKGGAEAVAGGECDMGIVICTTGIGISIVANKVKGIRCALCADTVSARLTRELTMRICWLWERA